MLFQALVEHCKKQKTGTIALWTAINGPGHRLYTRFGFEQNEAPDDAFRSIQEQHGEIRMRLVL